MSLNWRGYAFGAIALAPLCVGSIARAEVLQYHPNSPAYIGGNFDPSQIGRAYPPCLKPSAVHGESVLPGQKAGTASATEFFVKKVTSRQELYHILNVSLSMSGSYGLFSADFSGSLEHENTFSQDSFTFVVYGFSNYGKFILDNIDLNDRGKAAAANLVNFRNVCGTEYVQIEVRAVQASAVFTVKNLSQSDKQVLEASLSASYGASGAASIGVDAKFRDFIKTASQYGQIEVHVYAIGGPGITALSPIITQIDKPDEVLKTIQSYFNNLDLSQSAPIAYNTGSLQSLINRPNIEDEFYSKYVADLFTNYESLGAERDRLTELRVKASDYGLTDAQVSSIGDEVNKLDALRQSIYRSALACKDAFNDTNRSPIARRTACGSQTPPGSDYTPKFTALSAKPYYLRYFTSNELIPGEEVVNFQVRGPHIKTVEIVKGLNPATQTFTIVNSVQVHQPAAGGEDVAGTSITMKDILEAELPIGLRITLDSGSVYFEQFAFTRAPQPAPATAMFAAKIAVPGLGITTAPLLFPTRAIEQKAFKAANSVGQVLPAEWQESGGPRR